MPLVETPDDFAVLNQPGTLDGFRRISGGEWDNRCPARIFLTVLGYRPITDVDQVDCPVLVIDVEEDNIIPEATVDRLVNRVQTVEGVTYPFGHWDVYTGESFETVVAREASFLERHLLN